MGTESRAILEPHPQTHPLLHHPATVMVVDDEPRVGLLFEKVLSEEGYQVVTATSGRRALALAAAAPPDIILLDIVMPGLDGMATLRELRQQRHLGTVILITAHGTLTTAREAMALGAYDYITKPFRLEFLKAVLREGLKDRPEERDDGCAH
jgi:DNA-binding response OmpR family regulator